MSKENSYGLFNQKNYSENKMIKMLLIVFQVNSFGKIYKC